MKKKVIEKGIALFACMMLLTGCANPVTEETSSNAENTVTAEDMSQSAEVTSIDTKKLFSNKDKEIGYEESECSKIVMGASEIVCEDTSVKIEETTITITKAGTYLIQGTMDGNIIVDAKDDAKVRLILDNATIRCDATAPLYVKNADKVFVTLAPDSENHLINTGEFEAIDDNNIDGAVFAKDDITFNGLGSLEVVSKRGHGIVCKDQLCITSGTYQITAAKKGLSGKDSVCIANGDFNINSGSTGIASNNEDDSKKGFVYITGGNIHIEAENKGISAITSAVLAGGSVTVEKSKEGMEAKIVEIAGGSHLFKATDDGINASTGNDGSGMPGKNKSNTGDSAKVLISGGNTEIIAQGDGIDSNGTLEVSGGVLLVSGSETDWNSAIDYEYDAVITGGIVIAAGAAGMSENFGESSTQCSMMICTESSYESGTEIKLTDAEGNTLLSYVPATKYNSVVISSPQITVGSKYTLITGSDSREVVPDAIVYGTGIFGGGPGGFGGKGNGGRDRTDKFGEMPDFDGEMPDFGGEKPDFTKELPEGFDKKRGDFEARPNP